MGQRCLQGKQQASRQINITHMTCSLQVKPFQSQDKAHRDNEMMGEL